MVTNDSRVPMLESYLNARGCSRGLVTLARLFLYDTFIHAISKPENHFRYQLTHNPSICTSLRYYQILQESENET
jgi:hypothetical protein